MRPCVGGSRNRSIWFLVLAHSNIEISNSKAYAANILKRVQLRRQTTMNAEELLVHDSCQRQSTK